jgi:hypothetical protein
MTFLLIKGYLNKILFIELQKHKTQSKIEF